MTVEEINELQRLNELLRQDNARLLSEKKRVESLMEENARKLSEMKDETRSRYKAVSNYKNKIVECLEILPATLSHESRETYSIGVWMALGAVLSIDEEEDLF